MFELVCLSLLYQYYHKYPYLFFIKVLVIIAREYQYHSSTMTTHALILSYTMLEPSILIRLSPYFPQSLGRDSNQT